MKQTPDRGEDELRRHTEDPAEGADPDAASAEEDVPREHPEDQSEG